MLFFIVGGDYDSDGSANGATDGRGIVGVADAVVVVANYRLGVLGYGLTESVSQSVTQSVVSHTNLIAGTRVLGA